MHGHASAVGGSSTPSRPPATRASLQLSGGVAGCHREKRRVGGKRTTCPGVASKLLNVCVRVCVYSKAVQAILPIREKESSLMVNTVAVVPMTK